MRTDHEGRTVDVLHQFVHEEYLAFPVVSHDDMLDSLSRIVDTEMPDTRPETPPEKAPQWWQEYLEEHYQAGSLETL